MKKVNKPSDFTGKQVAKLLRAIFKEELRDFAKYLNVHASPGTLALWEVLKNHHPKFQISNEEIRLKVRPKNPISDGVFRVQIAELTKLTQAFLTMQEFQMDKRLYANTTAKVLMKRRVRNIYEKHRQKAKRILSGNIMLDAEFYHHQHQNKYIDFQYVTLNDPLKTDDSLQLASDFHDYNFLVKKLRYLIVMYNRQRIIKTTYNEEGEQKFLDYLDSFPLKELPLINAYYLILKLFKNATLENLIQFKDFFLPLRHKFDPDETRQLLTLVGNSCFPNIYNGQLGFVSERFVITKILVEENYLQVLGHFSHNHFRTSLRDAIEAGELDWAEWFLKTKLPETHPNHQKNLKTLGWALLHFAKGTLDNQEDFMLEMQSTNYKFTGFYEELTYRVLRLKTDFVRLGDHPHHRLKEAFQAHVKSFLRYCERREDIPLSTRRSRINFGFALRLIFNKRFGKKRVEEDVKTAILAMKPVSELPWLLQVFE